MGHGRRKCTLDLGAAHQPVAVLETVRKALIDAVADQQEEDAPALLIAS